MSSDVKIYKPKQTSSWQLVFDGLSDVPMMCPLFVSWCFSGSVLCFRVGSPGDSGETMDPTSTTTAGACNRGIAARGLQTHSRRRDDLCLLSQEKHDVGNMNPMLGKALLLANMNQMEYFKTRHKTSAKFFSRVDARLLDIADSSAYQLLLKRYWTEIETNIISSVCICTCFNILQYIIRYIHIMDLYIQ